MQWVDYVNKKIYFTLIKGFSRLKENKNKKNFPNYKLIILGDGPDRNKLNNLI